MVRHYVETIRKRFRANNINAITDTAQCRQLRAFSRNYYEVHVLGPKSLSQFAEADKINIKRVWIESHAEIAIHQLK